MRQPMQIKIKKLVPEASIEKSLENDAAFTIKAVSKKIEKGYIEYGLGISSEIPLGWVALVFPRSSISNKDLALSNAVGVIDPKNNWDQLKSGELMENLEVDNHEPSANLND